MTYSVVNSHGHQVNPVEEVLSPIFLSKVTYKVGLKSMYVINTAESSVCFGGGMLGGYLPRAPHPSHYPLMRLPVGAYLLVISCFVHNLLFICS